MVHFAEISQSPPPYSMLQHIGHIGRVATPKLVPRNCPRYLQTTLIMREGGLVSEFMWGIVGLESLQSSWWYKKLAMFYKIWKKKNPLILFKLIPEKKSPYATKNVDGVPLMKIKYNFFKNTFFRSAIIEWNKLDPTIRDIKSVGIFKINILKFIRPNPWSFFSCYNHKGIRLMALLRLGLSHLRQHKFNHNFQNCINSFCTCGTDIESTLLFFLRSLLFDDKKLLSWAP